MMCALRFGSWTGLSWSLRCDFFAVRGAGNDECIIVHGGAEPVYPEARWGRNVVREDLSQSRDLVGEILQLEDAIRWIANRAIALAESPRV